jgi:hypothetical protein
MKKHTFFSVIFAIFSVCLSSKAQQTTFPVCDVEKETHAFEEIPFKKLLKERLIQNHVNEARENAYQVIADSFSKQETRLTKQIKDKKKREAAIVVLRKQYDKDVDMLDSNIIAPTLEAFSRNRRPLVATYPNAFYGAVEKAYAEHRTLILSPDDVWLAICQGFSNHVAMNAEKLRPHFVGFEGKKTLNVMLGRWPAPDSGEWDAFFGELNLQIARYTGTGITETINANFSTTTAEAKVAYNIAMMSSMKEYFDYWGTVMCGIPEISLEGTPEDWADLERRADQLATYELQWWIDELKPLLSEFTAASKGQANPDFWKNILKHEEKDLVCASAPVLTGWISQFFPYVNQDGKMVRSPLIGIKDFKQFYKNKLSESGKTIITYYGPMVEPKELPESVMSVPVYMNDLGDLRTLNVHAGSFGIWQEYNTGALRPGIGWAIVDMHKAPEPEAQKRYDELMEQRKKVEAKKD